MDDFMLVLGLYIYTPTKGKKNIVLQAGYQNDLVNQNTILVIVHHI